MNLGTLQPRDPYGAVHCGKLCAARRRRVVEQVRAHGLRPHRLFVGRARGGGLALLRPPTLPGQGAAAFSQCAPVKLDRPVLNTCACSATTLPGQGTVFNQCVPVKPGRVVLNTLSGQGARRRVRQEQAVSGRPQTVPRGRLRLRPRYDYTASTAAQLRQMQYDTLRYEMLF